MQLMLQLQKQTQHMQVQEQQGQQEQQQVQVQEQQPPMSAAGLVAAGCLRQGAVFRSTRMRLPLQQQ